MANIDLYDNAYKDDYERETTNSLVRELHNFIARACPLILSEGRRGLLHNDATDACPRTLEKRKFSSN